MTPPSEVLEALGVAVGVLEELASRGMSVHFEYDDRANRIRVELLNDEGTVIRELQPSQLLDVAAGAEALKTA